MYFSNYSQEKFQKWLGQLLIRDMIQSPKKNEEKEKLERSLERIINKYFIRQ